MKYFLKLQCKMRKQFETAMSDHGVKLKKDKKDWKKAYSIDGVPNIKFQLDFLNPVRFFKDDSSDFSTLFDIEAINDEMTLKVNNSWLRYIVYMNVVDKESYTKCENFVIELMDLYLKPFYIFHKFITNKSEAVENRAINGIIERLKNRCVWCHQYDNSVAYYGDIFNEIAKGCRLNMRHMGIISEENEAVKKIFSYIKETSFSYNNLRFALAVPMTNRYNDRNPFDVFESRPSNVDKNTSELLGIVSELHEVYDKEILPDAIARYPELEESLKNDVVLQFNTNETIYWEILKNDKMASSMKKLVTSMSPAFLASGMTYVAHYEHNAPSNILISINVESIIVDIISCSGDDGILTPEVRERLITAYKVVMKHEIGHAIWELKLLKFEGFDAWMSWKQSAHKIWHIENRKEIEKSPDERYPLWWTYYMRKPAERKANQMMDISMKEILLIHPDSSWDKLSDKERKRYEELIETETFESIDNEQLKMLAASEV